MKKRVKKLTLHRETVCSLEDLRRTTGQAYTLDRTICVTGCVTNCAICNFEPTDHCTAGC